MILASCLFCVYCYMCFVFFFFGKSIFSLFLPNLLGIWNLRLYGCWFGEQNNSIIDDSL